MLQLLSLLNLQFTQGDAVNLLKIDALSVLAPLVSCVSPCSVLGRGEYQASSGFSDPVPRTAEEVLGRPVSWKERQAINTQLAPSLFSLRSFIFKRVHMHCYCLGSWRGGSFASWPISHTTTR